MGRRSVFSLGRVNYVAWFLSVFAWDGLLPLAMAAVPYVVEALFPNQRTIMEVIAVTLPIAAFFFRLRHGKTHIASNYCSTTTRRLQHVAFFIGILLLVLIDCVVILSHLMPPGALFQAREDRIVWTVLAAIYLIAMIAAMYPGQQVAENRWETTIPSAGILVAKPVSGGEFDESIEK